MKARMLRTGVRVILAFCAVWVCLGLFVEGLGLLGWHLSRSGEAALREGRSAPPPERHPAGPKALHRVEEWPAERGRNFDEAPMLARLVSAGSLPPVAERLPENPLVIVPPHQMGPYGGTWKRFATTVPDINLYEDRYSYEGLIRWGPMGRKILPNLAVRWKIEDGGRTYTFWLRKGVRWSDGHPFTVDDIVFWHEDVLKNKQLTPVVPPEYRRGGETMELDKVDDHTVRFRFKRPHGLFMKRMASNSYDMVTYPKHYLKNFHPRYTPEAQLDDDARAEGFDGWHKRFIDLQEWRNTEIPRLWAWLCRRPPPGQPVLFERNAYYYKVDPQGNQLPYIDRISFEILERETINLKAMHGEMGMQSRHMLFKNYPLFMENQRKGDYRVLHWLDGTGGQNALAPNMNHKDPVLRKIIQDRRFRIALSLAINRDEINELFYSGLAHPRQVSPPPGSAFYSPEYERAYTEYNPKEANRLLDEMGLNKRDRQGTRLRPDGKPLTLTIEMPDIFGASKEGTQLIAEYWTAVGVKSSMKLLARPLAEVRYAAMMHDVGVFGGSDEMIPVMDPRWFLPYSPSSYQGVDYARWFQTEGKKGTEPPPEIRRCMDVYRQIMETPDEAEQVRLFSEIIELNRKNLWVIGIVGQIPAVMLVKNNFKNVPEVAIGWGWVIRTPGTTAPECYAIQGD